MVNDFLLDLFRQEVNTNAETLNNGLVLLEREPGNVRTIEPLMRAAHSIKGAARVVGFDVPVKLAHVMEDCLVRAQEGKLTLASSDIDALLAGVDLLVQIAAAAGPGLAAWEAENGGAVESLRSRLEAVSRGEGAKATGTVQPYEPPAPPDAGAESRPLRPAPPPYRPHRHPSPP